MSRIAAIEDSIEIGSKVFRLRPSLRCASRLERHYDGFEPMARAIADGSFSTTAHVIYEVQVDRTISRSEIEQLLAQNLNKLDTITGQIITVILALAGVDDTPATTTPASTPKATSEAPKLAMADYFDRLFKLGTGWLGWSPSDTWNATPSEILAAYQGRTELLQAIFGGGATDCDSTDNPSTGPDTSPLDRDGLQALKSLGSL